MLHSSRNVAWFACSLCVALTAALQVEAQQKKQREKELPEQIADIFQPPDEFAGELGDFRNVLKFDDGRPVKTPDDWARRRKEIRRTWHQFMGPWPPLVQRPKVEVLESQRRDDFTQQRVRVQIAPDRTTVGYLLVPEGEGPFPAVVVPYYTAETGANLDDKQNRDYGYQLTKRGFVSLSIGTPSSRHYPSVEKAQLQPLSYLAYVAANCCRALANMENVDGERIGVVGHSYGGKWALFAAALYDGFACGAWSDPGIVFDESRSNVNYWDRWYLGYEPGRPRSQGRPSENNPRTGAYRELVAAGRDLHELHALLAPRPLLVSGGAEDPPKRWIALNHAVAVNRLLGYENRVAMTNRPKHGPRPQDNEKLFAFFEHFLK